MVSNSKRLEIAVLSIVCATLVSESVWAQITPDATLGAESSQVTPNAELRRADKQGQRADLIDGGARRGANLFHSFSEFNVGDGQRVYFANPDGIANILSRVTGTDVSDINGTLGVDGTANLFFLNPNGIRFGPNARLDVQGSFMATTGDSFLFSDGFAFGSTNPQAPPLLTVSAPVGVQYGGRIPGAIDISSGLIRLDEPNQFDYEGLDVLQGNSLLFLGGDINLTKGKLSAPGGRIELGGLAEAGMVGLQSNGQIFSLTFPSTSALSNITLTEGARVAVIGDGGGSIAVNANNLTASGGGRFVAGTGGVGDSRDVQINVQDRASFDGRQIINGESISSGVYNEVWKDAEGQGGNIFISTGSLSLTNGANLSTSTYGQGNAGDIVINARDRVSFDGGYADGIFFPSMALANVGEDPEKKFGRRQGGNIRITTGSLLLTDGGQLQTILDGSGNAGNIIINARDRISFNDGYVVEDEFFPSAAFNGIDTGGSGSAGDIRINTDRLFLGNGGGLIAYTFGEGDAGDIIIDAPNQILLDGGQIVNDVFFRTAVLSNVEDNGHGHGGNLRIRTRLLSVSHGAILETSTYGRGDTGNIVIDARNRVSFDGGQIVNDTFYRSAATSDVGKNARGQGGIIRINAGFLNITNGAGLFANINPRGRGNAGEIRIDANQISMDQSDILTNVRLNANGNAGRINILTDSLSLTSGAHVSSSSFGQGNAGSITIHANDSIQFDGQGKDLTVLDKIKIYVSGIFSNVEPQGQGTAGNISITTEAHV